MDLFRPRKIDSVQPKLVVARSLEKRNNVACAIEAFALVKQKYPRAEMTITGDGSQCEELQRLATREKLNGVTFTGGVSHHELSRYFAEADVYVNASSIDGLPTSLLEALAVGLPVVTTGAGGIPGVINDSINGLIVRPNDPSGLADRIIRLVESPELVQQLSEQAKLSSRDYSLAHVKGKWSELY
jgi:glycosyltransferase involved in cell wall biosynthesis